MRSILLLACACSCATMNTNQNPYQTPEERWGQDAINERADIACAMLRVFGPEIAATWSTYTIEVRRGIIENEETRHAPDGGLVMLNGAAANARSSPWEHAAVHVALFLRTGIEYRKPLCQEAPAFLVAEKNFKEVQRACAATRKVGGRRVP